MASLFDRIYAQLPPWAQNVGISAYGLVWRRRRYGGRFSDRVRNFTAREHFSSDEWGTYQQTQLRRLMKSTWGTVPYVRDILRDSGINGQDLEEFAQDHLVSLPLLEKETIRQQPERFLNRSVGAREMHTYHTSGTTGTPLGVVFTNAVHQEISAAYEARVRNWAGVDYKMSRAMIGGRIVVPDPYAGPPFWRYNLAEKQLYFSAFHISPQNAPHYADALNRYRPEYLVGYASAHYFLARMINRQGLDVHQPRAILTSSEKLTAEMRAEIEQAYRANVYDAYSGVENCCLISECEHHSLHVSPDVGYVELLDEAGQPVPEGVPGEIVATGFLNHAQPLIRYRTGDLAILSNEDCPCGRAMPVVLNLVGRLEDVIVGRDGRETVRFHGIFTGLPAVREGQIIQETVTEFTIRLVVEAGFGDAEKQEISRRFEQRLGAVDLDFEFPGHIERTSRGKFRAVISRVNPTEAGASDG